MACLRYWKVYAIDFDDIVSLIRPLFRTSYNLSCWCFVSVGHFIFMIQKALQVKDYQCFDLVLCRLCFVLGQPTIVKIKLPQLLYGLVQCSADLPNEFDQSVQWI
jgi:hypothetical protein